MMNLTEKEISNFNKARTEDDFYKQYSKVKEARNNILPNFLLSISNQVFFVSLYLNRIILFLINKFIKLVKSIFLFLILV